MKAVSTYLLKQSILPTNPYGQPTTTRFAFFVNSRAATLALWYYCALCVLKHLWLSIINYISVCFEVRLCSVLKMLCPGWRGQPMVLRTYRGYLSQVGVLSKCEPNDNWVYSVVVLYCIKLKPLLLISNVCVRAECSARADNPKHRPPMCKLPTSWSGDIHTLCQHHLSFVSN